MIIKTNTTSKASVETLALASDRDLTYPNLTLVNVLIDNAMKNALICHVLFYFIISYQVVYRVKTFRTVAEFRVKD